MPVAQVTVDYVNQPKEGKRFGSIKCKELGYVSVKPADLGQFQPKSSYQIEYTTSEQGYHNFVRIVAKANGHAPNGAPNMENSRLMFIMGVVGRAMGSGKFEIADIHRLTGAAASAWDETMAAKPKREELNDDIPY